MTYFEGGNALAAPKCLSDIPTIAFCTIEELSAVMEAVGIENPNGFPDVDQSGVRFESHKEFDSFSLHSHNPSHLRSVSCMYAVFNAMRLIIVHDGNAEIQQLMNALEKGEIPCEISAVLEELFDSAMVNDERLIEGLENDLLDLEQRIFSDNLQDCVSEIMQIRKTLLLLKRYYDGLFRILQGIEENRNGYIRKQALYIFRLLLGRVDRLSTGIVSLSDYATQVRDAYQNQMDIDLNQTMKLFTVITAIFLPLTLLAGWYGMNFSMPEYALPWAYPAFIAISASVIIGLLVYFKRKKWF